MITGEPQAYSEPAQVVSRMMQVTPTERKAVPAQSILCGTRLTGKMQHSGDDEQGDDAERNVDVEDPAPGQVLGEEAAEQGPGHVGDAEDDAEVAHVLATLAGRDDVAHDGLGPDHQPAGPDPLDGPEGDELDHGLGQPGQHRSRPGRSRWPAGRASCGRRGRPAFPTAAWRCRWSAGRPSPPRTGG